MMGIRLEALASAFEEKRVRHGGQISSIALEKIIMEENDAKRVTTKSRVFCWTAKKDGRLIDSLCRGEKIREKLTSQRDANSIAATRIKEKT
jgi:hypothetical protein